MGWLKWRQSVEKLMKASTPIELFHLFTITLLSLLLPLSFLLLSRLSNVQYLLTTLSPYHSKPSSNVLLSIFLFTNPTLLHFLVSIIGVTTLVHGLTGSRITLQISSICHPRIYIAWILLCSLQVCVCLGIEGTIAAGLWKLDYDVENETTFVTRIVFFVGLHETMIHWSRIFVRPIVDDTIFGTIRDERWGERVVMGASFAALWWWRMRDEVGGLVNVVEAKKESSVGLGIADFVGWWLYYLVVTIGMVRIVKGMMWVGKSLLCRGLEGSHGCCDGDDEKV